MVTPPISETSMPGSRCAVSHSSQVSRNAPSDGAGVIPAAANAWETRTPSTLLADAERGYLSETYGNALAVELGLFRRTYNTLRPHQALDDRTPRQAYVTGTGTQ